MRRLLTNLYRHKVKTLNTTLTRRKITWRVASGAWIGDAPEVCPSELPLRCGLRLHAPSRLLFLPRPHQGSQLTGFLSPRSAVAGREVWDYSCTSAQPETIPQKINGPTSLRHSWSGSSPNRSVNSRINSTHWNFIYEPLQKNKIF